MESAIIPSVIVTGEMIIGGLITLVGLLLSFVSRILFKKLDDLKADARAREEEWNNRLRTLGHEDRQIRQELAATRASVDELTLHALKAVTSNARLVAQLLAGRRFSSDDEISGD